MLDYWHGDAEGGCAMHRDDGYSYLVPVPAFFAGPPFNPLACSSLQTPPAPLS